jgi:glycosidase
MWEIRKGKNMSNPAWLKNAIIYNVYPQSFKDSDGDGIGDLKGVCEKLDYIKELGCNIIWMNPIFVSPFRDAGYDVTDFYKVAPRYGTNEDLQNLCNEAKKKGIHIVLDLVAGHTSLECEWFQRSAEYDRNEYSNRYIWTNEIGDLGDGTFINGYSDRDGAYMKNYYYCQPALNYGFAKSEKPWQLPVEHPDCVATRDALLDIMDFWSGYGVSGFRVDMAFSLVKNDKNEEANIKLWQTISKKFKEKHPDSLLISEWSYPERAINAGFDIDFLLQFNLKPFTTLFRHEKGKNDRNDWIGPSYFRKEGKGDFSLFSDEFTEQLNKIKGKGYMSVPTGTHDLSRVAWERDEDDLKVIQAFIMTMPGIPLVYYGDEIGMRYIEGMRSVEGAYKRTGSRTPMQWNNNKNHGFSAADKTYIASDSTPGAPNVEDEEKDENSLLNNMKRLIKIRKEHPALQEDGEFKVISGSYPAVYERSLNGECIRVIINPSKFEYKLTGIDAEEIYIKKNVETDLKDAVVGGCGFMVYKKR